MVLSSTSEYSGRLIVISENNSSSVSNPKYNLLLF
jgi:hypothetical protein